MPTYLYHCPHCGSETEEYNSIAERHTHAPVCCDAQMGIRPQASYGFVAGRWDAYKCVATGQVISSKRQRAEVLGRAGLVDADWAVGSHVEREKKRVAPLKALEAEYHKATPAEAATLAPAIPA